MSEIVPYTTTRPFTADWLLDPAEIAQRIGGTDFVPEGLRNNPAAITAALLYGQEVGLGRMQSLAKIAVINGRPTLAAEAQRALILAAGHDIWIDESTVSRCTVAGQRKGSDQISRVTWTMDDARRANLAGKQPWRQYPRQMLLARASAELARAVFPDAIGGLAATEELEDLEATQASDGPQPSEQKANRRRRANITAQPAAAPTGPPPAGDLPDDEQAVVDQIAKDFDATETNESEPKPPPISEPQRKKLHALFRDRGITDRKQRLAYCEKVIGRYIGSSSDLTLDEASAVIDQLEGEDYPWATFEP
jgi:hypothetical protein